MSNSDLIGPKEEYQTLRQELLESKRYVFERPLLIGAAGIAALGAFREVQATAVPLVIAALLLFNLWFTVNRLRSASRIVAYIQLQLEACPLAPWRGWETSLRDYRKWLKLPNAEATIDSELDHAAVPDALIYYPAIFRLHLGIAFFAVVSAGVMTLRSPSVVPIACLAGTVLLAAWFSADAIRHRPGKMRTLIEWNRVAWTYVLQGKLPSPAAAPGGSAADRRPGNVST